MFCLHPQGTLFLVLRMLLIWGVGKHSTLMTEENKTGQYLWSVTEVKTEKTPFLLSVAL